MGTLFNERASARFIFILGAAALGQPAAARDRAPPPPPCPLAEMLRVASAASLAGLQTLSQCANIVVAPASPTEYVPPSNRRIAPEPPQLRRVASPATAIADAADARSANFQVAAIAPKALEPAELTADALSLSADSILAMRPVSYSTPYDSMIQRVAARQRIDPLLLHAVIAQESRYHAGATSSAGARGLMQLMPGTARMLSVHGAAIVDAEANVDGGARLLRQLYGRFNDFSLTLAAYNAGEGAVRKYGNRIPPYAETQNYVRQVSANYQRLVAEQGMTGR